MLKQFVILTCVLSIFLVGCVSQTPVISIPVLPTDTLSLTATHPTHMKFTLTPNISLTPLPTTTDTPTPIATAAPNPTSTPKLAITLYEITIEPALVGSSQLDGVLVLAGRTVNENDCLLDFRTMHCTALPMQYLPTYLMYTISPDRTQFADLETYNQLFIVTADGQQQSAKNWNDSKKWQIIEWIDDQHLVLNELGNKDGLVREFNPFTGEWQELVPSFPDISENGELWSIERDILGPFVYYDPARTRVVMLRHREPQFHATYELWNVQTNELVWEKRGSIAFNSRPIWSRDGKHFAVIMGRVPDYRGEEASDLSYGALYIIGSDGQESEVTGHVVGELSWSPDESKIATWWRGLRFLGDDEYQNSVLYNPLAAIPVR